MVTRSGLALALLLQAADPPLPPGAKPTNHGAMQAGESPVWHPAQGLFFSGGGRITRRDARGENHVFREKAGTNGLLFDLEGRLVACESRNRRVTRTEPDGTITVLAAGYEGKQFNSPNDLTIDSKGRIYFTDPRYGNRDSMEMMVEGVYRIDAPGKVTRIIAREVDRPNGILVSPKDEFLYVADNNNNTAGAARQLVRFRLRANGTIDAKTKRVIFDWGTGRGPDGLEMDQAGRLYVAGGLNKPNPPYETADRFKGGVYILSP
ncbi:MAG: SMP-30/gluconolactonase/LRE family protein, partial [Bryobacteraceae bacterium]